MSIITKMFGAGKSPEAQKKSDKERYDELLKGGKSPGTALYIVGSERKKKSETQGRSKDIESIIEENAFKQEKQKRAQAKEREQHRKARDRGIARATPLSEKFGNTVAGIGKVIQSDAFQGAARMGANFSGYGNTRKKPHKKKGKKNKKGRRANQTRNTSASFFDML